ncbi:MAG: hypothetical protein KGZ25_00425 [Planctomycetes bacterium]|nr:hypothetical protein [Planctomycetota bacterium]
MNGKKYRRDIGYHNKQKPWHEQNRQLCANPEHKVSPQIQFQMGSILFGPMLETCYRQHHNEGRQEQKNICEYRYGEKSFTDTGEKETDERRPVKPKNTQKNETDDANVEQFKYAYGSQGSAGCSIMQKTASRPGTQPAGHKIQGYQSYYP